MKCLTIQFVNSIIISTIVPDSGSPLHIETVMSTQRSLARHVQCDYAIDE